MTRNSQSNRAQVSWLVLIEITHLLLVGCQFKLHDVLGEPPTDVVNPWLSISSPSIAATDGNTDITYTLVYLGVQSISLTSAEIALSTSGGANCAIAVSGSGNSVRTVTLSGCTGNGLVGISVAGNSAIDNAGRPIPPAGPSNQFTVDTAPPVFSAGQMNLNGGTASTGNNFVQVTLHASDATQITHFCLKYNDTSAPLAGDACWISVNAPSPGLSLSATLSLNGFPFRIGFTTGAYTVYAWAKDQFGRVSNLTSAGSGTAGQDRSTINFVAGSPPTVINFSSYSTDTPNSPPLPADYAVANPGNVFIKWNASDDQALPANPISLYYTTDDSTYVLIANNLPNSQGAGCTIDGTQTGCYVWNNTVTAGYLRLRIGATDANGLISYSSPAPMNVTSPFHFIAGNTDTGIGGSALGAVFFNDYGVSSAYADPGTLVITDGGTVYFRDSLRGILKVDPADGLQQLFIRTTGASTGDGGPAASATLRAPHKIALDFQNRLLVFDHDRIRRVDLSVSPPTISTIIGGGSQTADNIAPLDLQITPPTSSGFSRDETLMMPFFALPNGDLYFQSDTYVANPISGLKLRHYNHSTDRIRTISPSGTGTSTNAGQDITLCGQRSFGLSFDPVTSAITSAQLSLYGSPGPCPTDAISSLNPATWVSAAPHPPIIAGMYEPAFFRTVGRNGSIFGFSRYSATLARYNPATNNWTQLLGTGTVGSCADGTPALSCPVEMIDVFVSSQSKIYFIDRGRIRTIDDSGNVVTLFGQSFSFGDGGNPLSARFKIINNIALRNSGEIIVLDQMERKFREFTANGTIQTIAGNGSEGLPGTAALATTQPLVTSTAGVYRDIFSINPATGDVFFNRGSFTSISSGGYIARLDRGTGRWTDLAGGGANPYSGADGMLGANINLGGHPSHVLGFDGTRVLAAKYTFDGTTTIDAYLKLYDTTASGTQSHLLGRAGNTSFSICADGTANNNCSLPQANEFSLATFDSFGNRWLLLQQGTNTIRSMINGGTPGTLTTLASNASSFAYKRDAGLTINVVFYCSVSDEKIHKKDIIASTDVTLAWPVPTMKCAGRSLIYDSANDRLIFPYTHSGVYGIAEYLNP